MGFNKFKQKKFTLRKPSPKRMKKLEFKIKNKKQKNKTKNLSARIKPPTARLKHNNYFSKKKGKKKKGRKRGNLSAR